MKHTETSAQLAHTHSHMNARLMQRNGIDEFRVSAAASGTKRKSCYLQQQVSNNYDWSYFKQRSAIRLDYIRLATLLCKDIKLKIGFVFFRKSLIKADKTANKSYLKAVCLKNKKSKYDGDDSDYY